MNNLDLSLADEMGVDYDEYMADNYEYSEFDKWYLTNEDEVNRILVKQGIDIENYAQWDKASKELYNNRS